MKPAAFIILNLAAATAGYSQFEDEPFQSTYWFADAVVTGTVVGVSEETFDFEVREWMRARECPQPTIIRASRYALPSDVAPPVYVPLTVGSRYLLLLRKPHDQGAGDNPHWLVLLQTDLSTSSVCLIQANGLRLTDDQLSCQQSIKLSKFLDALRTFDNCFVLYDDPIKGTYPAVTKCSHKARQAWAGRSALHAELVASALRAIERQSPR